jgi:RNA polymerase sigma factor (sigma-70 family)
MTTVSEQEKELRERIRYVELLGELNLSYDWQRQFGTNVANLVRDHGSARALRVLEEKCPSCLAVYLVAKGIYGYLGGNYWSSVEEDTELTSINIQQQLGLFFEQFLHSHGLPSFPGVGGRRYVDIILLHGGIPNYSLNDFFNHVLNPAILHPELYGASAREVIATWLDGSSQSSVDKPIIRFLQHGGKLAIDFVARSLDMGKYYIDHGVIPSARDVGLPQRVISAYEQWARDQSHAKQASKSRLLRPVIILDPWGEGLLIDLPSQIIYSSLEPGEGAWNIQSDQKEFAIPLSTRWRNDHWETEAGQVELSYPASVYSVTLTCPQFKRTWQFQGITSQLPLLVFDPENGNQVPLRDTLPAKSFWLLYPRGQELQIRGGKKREVFPYFEGMWEPYQAEEWDLTNTTSIQIGQRNIFVEPDLSELQPYLSGNEVNGLSHLHGEPRIFVGSPPDIHLPLPPQRDPQIEVARWRVAISLHEDSSFHTLILAELPHSVEQHTLRVSLAKTELLGQKVTGLYDISLRGPLGRDAAFSIAILPVLRIHMRSQDRTRLPDEAGNFSEPQFVIMTSNDFILDSTDQNIRIIAFQQGSYRVTTPSDYTWVELLLRSRSKQSSVKIPLTLPLPCIRWSIIEAQQTSLQNINWQTKVIVQPRAWLEQAEAPRLLVSPTPIEDCSINLSGNLLVYYDKDCPPQSLQSRGKARKRLVFNLSEAIDSIRTSHSGYVQIVLALDELPGQDKVILPVMRLTQTLDLGTFVLDSYVVGNVWSFSFSWQKECPLHNRLLRFWSLWRPWEAPVTIPIPDAAQKRFASKVSLSDLPPGFYRAEVTITDPWSSQEDQRPAKRSLNTLDVMLGSQKERQTYLASLPRAALSTLERILASQDLQTHSRLVRDLDHQYDQQFVSQLFEALLVLWEANKDIARKQPELFSCLQRHLIKSPVRLLALTAKRSLLQEQSVRWQFEELLSQLAPGLGLGSILNQLHLNGSISLSDVIPGHQRDTDTEAEVFSILSEAGIRIQETDIETEPADTQQMADISDLYKDLSDYHLDDLRQYLREISRYPLLTSEQERTLALQVREGKAATVELEKQTVPSYYLQARVDRGRLAYEELVHCNLRLPVSIAKRYLNRGLELLDLVQEGNLGLLRAIDKFDATRGYRFSTYATWWIRQAISRAIAEQVHLIRLPVYKHEELTRLMRAKKELLLELEREPTDKELANQLSMTAEKVRELKASAYEFVSLDAPLGEEGETSLGDLVILEDADPQAIVSTQALKEQIDQLLSELNSRQRSVLELRFGLKDGIPHTLEQIGQTLHVTRERVRQIEDKALQKLKALCLNATYRDIIGTDEMQ